MKIFYYCVMESRIQKVLNKLLDNHIKYSWWYPGKENNANYADGKKDIRIIRKEGINCVGVINLIKHEFKKPIPPNKYVKGGTRAWFDYLNKNKLIEEYDIKNKYPKYSLLIRDYKNPQDQGHVALVYENDNIIHAIPENNKIVKDKLVGPGVTVTKKDIFGPKYFTHIAIGTKWI